MINNKMEQEYKASLEDKIINFINKNIFIRLWNHSEEKLETHASNLIQNIVKKYFNII